MTIKSTKKHNLNRKTKKTKQHIVEILTDTQIEKINTIKNQRDKAIILFLLNTGLRVSEFVNLNYQDVFENIKNKVVKSEIIITGKGNKERTIPLNNTARQSILTIDRYNRTSLEVKNINRNYPVLISRQASRLSRQQIHNICQANLETHPHVLRHTCLTNLKNNGVDGVIIQKLAGHSDYNTTAKYYLSVSSEDIKNAVDTLSRSNPQILRIAK